MSTGTKAPKGAEGASVVKDDTGEGERHTQDATQSAHGAEVTPATGDGSASGDHLADGQAGGGEVEVGAEGSQEESGDTDIVMARERQKEQTVQLLELPEAILLKIFSCVRAVEDFLSLAQTCSVFSYLSKNGSLWKELCLRYFPFTQRDPKIKPQNYSWKGFFQRLWTQEQYWELGTLVRKRERIHLAGVTGLSLHRSQVATGSFDHQLRLWDCKTGRPIRLYKGHAKAILCVFFADELLATGSADGEIRIWSPASRKCMHAIPDAHTDGVSAIVGDPSRNLLVTGGNDSLIKVWDTLTGNLLRTLSGPHDNAIRALELHLFRLFSGAMDTKLVVWNVNAGEVLNELKGHKDTITCIKARSELLVSGGRDQRVLLWNYAKSQLLREFKTSSPVQSIDMDASRIVAGTQIGSVHVFSLYTHKEVRMIDMHDNSVNGLALGNKFVVSCSTDRMVTFTHFTRRQAEAKKPAPTQASSPRLRTAHRAGDNSSKQQGSSNKGRTGRQGVIPRSAAPRRSKGATTQRNDGHQQQQQQQQQQRGVRFQEGTEEDRSSRRNTGSSRRHRHDSPRTAHPQQQAGTPRLPAVKGAKSSPYASTGSSSARRHQQGNGNKPHPRNTHTQHSAGSGGRKWNPSPFVATPRLFVAPPSYQTGPRNVYSSQVFDYNKGAGSGQGTAPRLTAKQLRDAARAAYMTGDTPASRWVLKRLR
eukprot:TRINITY_DN4551_c2_g1_i1.p1 TRINITY_DN4551_c2_g1~~TRINITY_DN4551_c2_g1_i1.p1  ORF type:complete len:704 (-),score=88.63 TRINITY_DN4551_c2_g1_i1:56-2167(-)